MGDSYKEILEYLRTFGKTGRTAAELATHFGFGHKDASNRLQYLQQKKQVERAGKSRGEKRSSPVWVAKATEPFDSIVNADF